MKKISLIFFLLLGIGSGMFFARNIFSKIDNVQEKKIEGTTSKPGANIPEKPKEEKTLDNPQRMTIERLDLVDVAIEHVGLDPQGKMDVPKNDVDVAWFDLGYIPGSTGNSVIAGHYDRATGAPAVFYNLNKIQTGDEIVIKNDNGIARTFKVTDKIAYPYDSFPTNAVFGKSDKRMLNLITCDGTWDPVKKNYSNRLVVFSELVD